MDLPKYLILNLVRNVLLLLYRAWLHVVYVGRCLALNLHHPVDQCAPKLWKCCKSIVGVADLSSVIVVHSTDCLQGTGHPTTN